MVLLALLVMVFLALALCSLVFAWVGSTTRHWLHDHLLGWIRHGHWLWHRHRHRHRHRHGHWHGGCDPSLTGARSLTGSSGGCTPSGSTQCAQTSQHFLETHRGIFLGSASLEGCAGLCLCISNRNSVTFRVENVPFSFECRK